MKDTKWSQCNNLWKLLITVSPKAAITDGIVTVLIRINWVRGMAFMVQVVGVVTVCDYTNERAYRLINPKYKNKHDAESIHRDESGNQAWDDVDYIDLDVEEDFLSKLEAIATGQDYDTRVQMQVDFSDEELLTYMKLAHKRDITFNAFVEEALRAAIEQHKLDQFTNDYAQDLG